MSHLGREISVARDCVPGGELVWRQHGWDAGAGASSAAAELWILRRSHDGQFWVQALMGGLGLSGFVHRRVAIGLLVAFLLLSAETYLATYTMGEFHLSFWNFGPTELRVLLAVGNIALLWHPMVFHGKYRLFDVGERSD